MRYSRLIGVIYVVGAVLGLIMSVGGLLTLWITKSSVTESITGTVALAGRTLQATHDTMAVIGDSLNQASTDLTLLTKMVDDMASTLEDSGTLIHSTGDLVGKNMVEFVNNTQSSLTSVQTSARVVDDFLGVVSNIPFIGGRYRPDVPLSDSVARVSSSMAPLPGALTKIQHDLDVSAANVATIKGEVKVLGQQISSIQTSISKARGVVEDYQSILMDAQTRYDAFQKRLPVLLDVFYIGMTGLLIWIFILQLGMLLHGVSLTN